MVRVPFVLMALVAPAFGQPKAPMGRVPTRAVPCAMDDLKLAVTGDEPVVCWAKGCMKLELRATKATPTARPPVVKDWLLPVAEVKDTEVCVGTTCKKLGKKLIAAIAQHKKDLAPNDPPDLHATTDLKAVIVGADKVFSVATDRELKFAPPRLYARSIDKPSLIDVAPAGTLIVLSWSACAGPCAKFSLANSSGRLLGREGDGGGPVFQLDGKRFVVASEFAGLSIFELGTGKPRGTFPGRVSPEDFQIVRVDDSAIFLMAMESGGQLVSKIAVDADQGLAPFVDGMMFLPRCTP